MAVVDADKDILSLDLTISERRLALVKFLLERAADANLTNAKGMTALHYARKSGNKALIDAIEPYFRKEEFKREQRRQEASLGVWGTFTDD